MADRITDLFDTEQRNLAKKSLDYFDGKSKNYTHHYLSSYRRNALTKGMTARTRNLVKPIIEKSGMLFAGRPPVLQVYDEGSQEVNETATLACQELFTKANYIEYYNNFDPTVRLLKTCMTLVQFDSVTGEIFFTLLTPANSAVHIVNREIETLIYYTGREDEFDTYRVWTKEVVQDLKITTGGGEQIVTVAENPYGIIPVAVGYDTNLPRDGFWNPIPEDLNEIQEIYNLHVTNAEYAIYHAELQTLFTNAQIQGTLGTVSSYEAEYGSKLGPRMVTGFGGGGFVGGPGEAVAVETPSGESVFLEYKGPTPDIKPFDDVIKGWYKDFARDWNVTVEEDLAGSGSAVSGFSLVVKEIPNMQLRQKRQRMFETHFKRLYEVILVIDAKFGLGLTQGTELYAQFSAPELPVDEKSSEEVWTIKINEGRASKVDYYMVQYGQSREEAEATVKQIILDEAAYQNARIAAGLQPPKTKPVVQTTNTTDGSTTIRTAV